MANLKNRNKKAILDIFAMEDAKGVCEAFSGQLDMGAPVDDDTEYGLEDMMTVNPYEGATDGEAFMQAEDDMQSPETQKFVIDQFAAEAAKLPGNSIEVSDIPALATVIQAQNGIKGDVTGFLEKTMMDTAARLTAQNVSPALPSGVVAEDGFDAHEAAPAENGFEGIPSMDPIEQSAEPSLQANVDENVDLGGGDGLDNLDLGLGDEAPAPEGDAAAEPVDDFGNLDSLNDEDFGDLDTDWDDDEKPADEDGDKKDDEKTEDADKEESSDDGWGDDDEGSDKKEDDAFSDADFDFESVGRDANGLLEADEVGADNDANAATDAATDDTATDATATETEDGATEDGATEEAPVVDPAAPADTQCAQKPADMNCALHECAANLSAIRTNYMTRRTAERVGALVESYQRKAKKASTLAKLESVVTKFKTAEKARKAETAKAAQLESIVANFAKASAAPKAAPKMESVSAPAKKEPGIFAMIESAKRSIGASKAQDAKLESIIADVKSSKDADSKLSAIIEGVRASKAAAEKRASLQGELDAIIESAKSM